MTLKQLKANLKAGLNLSSSEGLTIETE